MASLSPQVVSAVRSQVGSGPESVPEVRMAKAREVSSRLRSLFVERRRNLAAIAGELALLQRERLYGLLGYTSVAALAWAEYGMGKSKVSELIGIVEGGWVLPRIREAFEGGRLEWTKARELVRGR